MSHLGESDFKGIVVAAGHSTRLAGPSPKQFRDLGGRSVLERSVHAVASRPAVASVIVVLSADAIAGTHGAAARGWPGVERVVTGGVTRAESALRGVRAAHGAPFVIVHDAARPFASPTLIDAVIEATRCHGAAIPVLEIPDTVKSIAEGRITATVPRDGLGLAQTPQGARTEWLLAALDRAERDQVTVTDEAAALERDGHRVATVRGESSNRKITTPRDLAEARSRLDRGAPSMRVGTGFDVHRFDAARPLRLGGVLFEDAPGLAGHSDADVVLHAAMDALLGAAGLGDIGAHFPPDDPRYEGAVSTDLARQVAALLEERGLGVLNLDLTLLAEVPRIRPRVEEMRAAIGDCLTTEPSRIGLKATTLEGLGALGRGEGIACLAVALIAPTGPSVE